MRTIDLDGIMSCVSCMPRADVAMLMQDKEHVSMRDIALAAHVPEENRLWLLLKMLTETEQHEAACRFAETDLWRERRAGHEPDARRWAAIQAKRAWLRGEINDDALGAARDAAHAAARSALWDAAWRATHSASWNAAWLATRSVARSVARNAARRHLIEIVCDLVGVKL